jgi:gluconate 2-dehydrogenase gamma chain
VITGYFTSDVGITQERKYLPVPGRYDGAYPYSEVNRVFSS